MPNIKPVSDKETAVLKLAEELEKAEKSVQEQGWLTQEEVVRKLAEAEKSAREEGLLSEEEADRIIASL
ncbi:MAG: hypothetical protein NC253_11275 [Ruminococcus sp.]|nr:hypothetical protein [Ruminococcus sp.]MCM1381785.1 hypothetical protein [Muribaculaceae bacterium]MCM1479454.1 hypothetical protein [Muribaculaceae bacterium]